MNIKAFLVGLVGHIGITYLSLWGIYTILFTESAWVSSMIFWIPLLLVLVVVFTISSFIVSVLSEKDGVAASFLIGGLGWIVVFQLLHFFVIKMNGVGLMYMMDIPHEYREKTILLTLLTVGSLLNPIGGYLGQHIGSEWKKTPK